MEVQLDLVSKMGQLELGATLQMSVLKYFAQLYPLFRIIGQRLLLDMTFMELA